MASDQNMVDMYRQHHRSVFAQHGETPQGVDWGKRPEDHIMRLDNMLAVVPWPTGANGFTMLDVGSGFGSLLGRARELNLPIHYTGIELVKEMAIRSRERHPEAEWLCGDVMTHDFDQPFDYVVNNGVLTQKLDASIAEMDAFVKAMIRRMFALCRYGIAFNLMTTRVNFMAPNLYYKSPVEMLAWCMSELTSKVRLDHSYPLYEYTMYLYRDDSSNNTHTITDKDP